MSKLEPDPKCVYFELKVATNVCKVAILIQSSLDRIQWSSLLKKILRFGPVRLPIRNAAMLGSSMVNGVTSYHFKGWGLKW